MIFFQLKIIIWYVDTKELFKSLNKVYYIFNIKAGDDL